VSAVAKDVPEPARGEPAERAAPVLETSIRAVREGHGANCSSIGSVIDTLFATATVGAAVFAAVVAALAREPVRVAGVGGAVPSPESPEPAPPGADALAQTTAPTGPTEGAP